MSIKSSEEKLSLQAIGSARFPSGQVSISDSSFFFDDAVIVRFESGVQQVELGLGGDGGIRVVRIASRPGTRGAKLGEFGVDFAQVCVCDRARAEAAFESLGDEGMQQYYDALSVSDAVVSVRVGGCDFLLLRPHSGDGRYSVYEWMDRDGIRCGVELDFSRPAP